ncbi:Hypothetical predicted protein [Pelobates cultripes]|uniref:Uncharacterized protein n=1 Tax=Pelobates cultripes TaxID=61616 RepID=A0AAD1S0T0_PELCU|nr:Hypothetical predicted protein [Pelobates cultripes]
MRGRDFRLTGADACSESCDMERHIAVKQTGYTGPPEVENVEAVPQTLVHTMAPPKTPSGQDLFSTREEGEGSDSEPLTLHAEDISVSEQRLVDRLADLRTTLKEDFKSIMEDIRKDLHALGNRTAAL